MMGVWTTGAAGSADGLLSPSRGLGTGRWGSGAAGTGVVTRVVTWASGAGAVLASLGAGGAGGRAWG